MCVYFNARCFHGAQGYFAGMFPEDCRPLPGHVYRIVDRGRPVDGVEFCSMRCAQEYVSQLYRGRWECYAETFDFDQDGVCVHEVEIRKKQKTQTESTEMGPGTNGSR
jgi:hypothetical protein